MTTTILGITEVSDGQINQYITYNEALRDIEASTNDFFAVDLTTGDAVLTSDQFNRAFLFKASGNAVPRSITVPQSKRSFAVFNGGSSDLTVIRGSTNHTLSDGTGGSFSTDGTTDGLINTGGGSGGSGGSLVFQDQTVNADTVMTALPNGTSQVATISLHNNSNPGLDSSAKFGITATEVRLEAAGSALPIDIYTNSSLSASIGIDGSLVLAKTGAKLMGVMSSSTVPDNLTIQSMTANGNTIFNIAPNGTGTVAGYNIFGGSDIANSAYFGFSQTATENRISCNALGSGVNKPISVRMGATRPMDISTAGNVGFGVLAPDTSCRVQSSNGFKPGNTANANANVWDWYEEGNIASPAIVGTTLPGAGTYTTQTGQFTRDGNKCTFTSTLGWSAHTGTGNMRFSGLPFTSVSLASFSIQFNGLVVGAGKQLSARLVSAASTQIAFFVDDLAGGASVELPMDLSVTSVTISGEYFV